MNNRRRLSIEEIKAKITGRYDAQNENQEPGRPSDYIELLDDVLQKEPNIRPILYPRVSTPAQKSNGNLDDLTDELKMEMERRGIQYEIIYPDACNGSIYEERTVLKQAFEHAKRINSIVVTTVTDRFIRPDDFHPSQNPYAKLSIDDLEALKKLADGARLATIHNPDAPPELCKSYHTKRGMKAKGDMGGRPRKITKQKTKAKPGELKVRRLEKKPLATELRNKGLSYSKISEILGIPSSVLWEWSKRPSGFLLQKIRCNGKTMIIKGYRP